MHEGDKWEVYIPAKWGYGSITIGARFLNNA